MASRSPARRNALLAGTVMTAVLACFAVVDLPLTAEAHNPTGLVAIDSGWSRTCALIEGGRVQCWGAIYGLTATDVQGLSNEAEAISVGGAHACVVTVSAGAKCWGANAEGQLGDGTFGESLAPVYVSGLSTSVSEVAAGGFFSCARLDDGGAKCWGDNSRGQLGDGTSGNYRTTPVDVTGLSDDIVVIAAGDDHACAITIAGGVVCWGNDTSGELGDGASGGLRSSPAPVSGLASGVRALALGTNYSCAVLTSGGATCWGNNSNGQLGNGTTGASATPVDVEGLSNGVAALAAGDGSTCALMVGGVVKCWGANNYGQVGDGTTTRRLVPVDVVGPEYLVASVTAGSAFACVVKYPGRASCWGLNDSGQLGDGTLLQRPLPVDVLTEVKPTPPKTPVEVVEGDANCDERVDSIDAAVVLQFSAGLLKEAPCSFSADANDDFSVDSRDATLILQHVAGLVVL